MANFFISCSGKMPAAADNIRNYIGASRETPLQRKIKRGDFFILIHSKNSKIHIRH